MRSSHHIFPVEHNVSLTGLLTHHSIFAFFLPQYSPPSHFSPQFFTYLYLLPMLMSLLTQPRYHCVLHAQWECSPASSVKISTGMGSKGGPWQWWSRLAPETSFLPQGSRGEHLGVSGGCQAAAAGFEVIVWNGEKMKKKLFMLNANLSSEFRVWVCVCFQLLPCGWLLWVWPITKLFVNVADSGAEPWGRIFSYSNSSRDEAGTTQPCMRTMIFNHR